MSYETNSAPPTKAKRHSVMEILWERGFAPTARVTKEDIAYFREHPDQIDDVAAPMNLHKLFLAGGVTVGVALVAVSKLLAHTSAFAGLPTGVEEFLVDIVFEIGVALVGGAIVAYFLGVVLNQQQRSARAWRRELRRRIAAAPPPLG